MANELREIVKESGISMTESARRLFKEGEITQQTLEYYEKLESRSDY